MRVPTHTLILTATLAATLGAAQPASALGLPTSDNPMTPDEKREQSRLNAAGLVAIKQRNAAVWSTYAKKCEAAFARGNPIPEKDLAMTEELVVGEELLSMTREELSEQSSLASTAFRAANAAIIACEHKYLEKWNNRS